MKIVKKIAVLLAVIMVLSVTAFAAEASLTVKFVDNGTPIVGAQFELYRVGQIDENGLATLDEALGIDASLWEMSQSEWRDLSLTVHGAVHSKQMESVVSGTTDADGILKLEGLEKGLYLLAGTPHTQNNLVYTPEAYLITLPVWNAEGDDDYNPTVEPKYETSDELISRKVLKIWDDASNESARPASVEVQLFENGTVYDTVTLSKDNNWQYEWPALKAASTWTIAEKVPAGYTSKVTQDGNTFVVTNTANPVETTAPTEPKLPDTGQLSWPIPVLAVAGIALFLVGWLRRKQSVDEG